MHLVLVIGKDPEISRTVNSSLDASWSRVWTCYNPKDAISMISQQEPAVIIVDGRSDIFSAIEVVRRIKKNLRMDHISCLLFTAGTFESDELGQAGVDDTLAWPSAVPVISHKIRLLLEKYESKKIRKGHQLEVESPEDGDILKSNSQYDDQQVSDPFHLHRKSLFVPPDPAQTPSSAPPSWDRQNSIEVPDDFFADTEGLDIEKTSHTDESATDLTEFAMNTVGRLPPQDSSQNAFDNLKSALGQLTPERIDRLAEKVLEQKLTSAAKENIKKLISRSVHEELEKLMPEIIDAIQRRME